MPRPSREPPAYLGAPVWRGAPVEAILRRELYRGVQVYGRTKKRNQWGEVKQSARPASEWTTVKVPALRIVSDETWAQLKAHFTERQCMDAVFTAGQYTQVSMMLNTFGVQLDEGQELDPDLDAR